MSNVNAYIEYKDYHLAIPITAKNNLLKTVKLVDSTPDKILDTKLTQALLINPYSMHFNKAKIFHEWSEADYIDFIEILVTIFSDPYVKLYIPSVVIEFWAMSTEKYILLYNNNTITNPLYCQTKPNQTKSNQVIPVIIKFVLYY